MLNDYLISNYIEQNVITDSQNIPFHSQDESIMTSDNTFETCQSSTNSSATKPRGRSTESMRKKREYDRQRQRRKRASYTSREKENESERLRELRQHQGNQEAERERNRIANQARREVEDLREQEIRTFVKEDI